MKMFFRDTPKYDKSFCMKLFKKPFKKSSVFLLLTFCFFSCSNDLLIKGLVYHDVNTNGLPDDGENAVSSFTIESGNIKKSFTPSDGQFELRGQLANKSQEISLYVSADGYSNQKIIIYEYIELEQGSYRATSPLGETIFVGLIRE